MKKLYTFGLLVLLVLAGTAMASQTLTVEEVGKDAYLDAVDAYYTGTITAAQKELLKAVDFREPSDPGNIITRIGGPDGAGYTFIDSEENDGPTYNWVDISDGTNWAEVDQLSDDDYIGPYDIGFSFPFYQQTYSQFWIQSNGTINFSDQSISLSNTNIPSPNYNAFIAWFWDDLDPNNGTQGQCYFEAMTIGNQNALVVSFHNWDEYPDGDAAPNLTAQIILFEDGTVRVQYNHLEGAVDVAGATIGIQGDAGFAGLEYMYNGTPAGYPYDGLAIEYSTDVVADANLSGNVSNTNGNPISGATVQVGNNVATTGPGGNYQFTNLFPGTYNYTVTADGYFTATGTLTLASGNNTEDFTLNINDPNADILLVDADPTPNGDTIATILNDLGYTTYYVTEFNEDDFTAGYDAIFVFVGIYSNYFAVYTDDPAETMMVNYLNQGGNLYIEGGDIFGFNQPANLLAMLNLDGIADGSGDLDNVAGVAGTFTEGVSMSYAGENNWIDHINGINTAQTVFTNPADGEGCGVMDNTDSYNTACFSFEVANLVDGDYTRAMLIEDILEYWEFSGGGPVTLELMGTTTVIPPAGGTLVYDVHLVSTLPNTVPGLSFWTDVILPNGQTYGPLMQVPFTLTPFMDAYVTGLTQAIPAFAPGGQYTFTGHAGLNVNIQVMDDFGFEKIGVAASGVNNWDATPFNLAGDASEIVSLPATFELKDVYPNPFNPTANVTVALPTAAELTVAVYNVMGQQVAELASGQVQAGTHSFVLDGASFASGIYFVQATVPGELNSVQKVTLMK